MKLTQTLRLSLLCINFSLILSSSASDPSLTQEYFELAESLYKEGKKDKAITYYKKTLSLDPNNIEANHHLGNALREIEMINEAVLFYRKALELDPQNLLVILELANSLNMLDLDDESLDLYIKALEINPTFPAALHNFAFTLKKKGFVAEAIDVFHKLLNRYPNYALARFNLSTAYLTMGDFERGWEEYEWRWQAYNESPKKFEKPLWDGCSLNGKTILVYAEQGLGDTFQFIRYIPLLKAQGAQVIFETQQPLATILRLCPYIDHVTIPGMKKPEFDYHIALMTLPLLFKTRIETVPANIPYLYADQNLVTLWKNKLSTDKNFKIGICWNGNSKYPTQALRRSVMAKALPLKSLAELSSIPGVSLYSLQKMDGMDQLREIPQNTIKQFDEDFDVKNGRFMDTAAVMKNLDLIITCDTSIAHLAGALGVPVWLLLPKPADWRWIINRDDTPWYPNMRLFNQETPHDWQTVFETIRTELTKEVVTFGKQKQITKVSDPEIEDVIKSTLSRIHKSPSAQSTQNPATAQKPSLNDLEQQVKKQVEEMLASKQNAVRS
jgi:tetratricopeptide (TPR) repeat protein